MKDLVEVIAKALVDHPDEVSVSEDVYKRQGFILRSFNEARFSPSVKWKAFIQYLAQWITGKEPDFYPASIVHYGTMENLEDSEKFEHCRKEAIEKGVRWLEPVSYTHLDVYKRQGRVPFHRAVRYRI